MALYGYNMIDLIDIYIYIYNQFIRFGQDFS